MAQHQPSEYRYIKAWGRWARSGDYYINQEQEQAAKEGAPLNALFRRYATDGYATGGWETTDDLGGDRLTILKGFLEVDTYTIIGLIYTDTGEKFVAGVLKGEHSTVDRDDQLPTAGYGRFADQVTGSTVEEALERWATDQEAAWLAEGQEIPEPGTGRG